MTNLRQAAQQALEAWDDPMGMKDLCVAMDALRTALEQQAEPVHGDIRALKYRIHELEGEVMGYKRMLDVAEAASQPQQQAEPVCEVIDGRGEVDWISFVPPAGTSLYTAAPQRKWVGLTDEQIRPMCKESWVFETVKQWVRIVEAAHGIQEPKQ